MTGSRADAPLRAPRLAQYTSLAASAPEVMKSRLECPCQPPVHLRAFALLGRPAWVGVGAGIAATTDMLDGWLSRKWHQTSAFGSRLDSLADHLLAISMVAWLLLLRPEFFLARLWPMLGWSAFALGVLGVSLLRFGRAVDLHLYSAKVAVILAFVFAVPLLVTGRYAPWQFWLTLAAACFAAAEALVVLLTRDRVDEHIGTVLRPSYWRRKR